MKPATLLSLASLIGLLVLAVLHFDQRGQVERLKQENSTLRERIDSFGAELERLRPLTRLMAKASDAAIAQPYDAVQVIGPPDVRTPGTDSPLAWCPPERDTGRPWLLLSYPDHAPIVGLSIHANSNPGAIIEVSFRDGDGHPQVVWSAPAVPAASPQVLEFSRPVSAEQIKLVFDLAAVTGWNEIDAVEAHFADGSSAWASAAEASGSWVQPVDNE